MVVVLKECCIQKTVFMGSVDDVAAVRKFNVQCHFVMQPQIVAVLALGSKVH